MLTALAGLSLLSTLFWFAPGVQDDIMSIAGRWEA